MAIIDNHKSVKIDKSFEDKHPEMFKFFNDAPASKSVFIKESGSTTWSAFFLSTLDLK